MYDAGASTTTSAPVLVQVLGHPSTVAEAGTGCSLWWWGSRHFGLTISVKSIVDRGSQGKLLLVIGHAELESPNQGIQPGGFFPAGTAWGHIRIPDDPAHLD